MSLDDQFNEAQVKVKTLPAQPNDVLLDLYALFKQATTGDVSGKKPGMIDFVKKAKYEAWETKKGQSQDEAKQNYVDLVDQLIQKAS